MKQAERNGFAIILAVAAVALVGAAVLLLADMSDTLMFDSDLAYLQACNRNLSASALAWARQNQDKLRDSGPSERIQLDVERLGIPAGNLNVAPLKDREKVLRVQIDTQCGRNKMKLERTCNYLVTTR